MSGGFFRGTSADQDTRFSNKQAKLLKSQKFSPELDHLVDMRKVNMEVIKPWITRRVTELLGFEDEVLINFIHSLLDAQEVNGKEVQIQITGFMEKNTGKFMKELWTLLLSAQQTASGVPQQLLDAKLEDLHKKNMENDRIASEIQRKKDREGIREIESERLKKMDDGFDSKETSTDVERVSKIRDVDDYPQDGNGFDKRNGVRARKRGSRSPYSPEQSTSSHRVSPSRSISRSNSHSQSHSGRRSRSMSGSPSGSRGHSLSRERKYSSPRRRSISPRRRHSPWVSPSPRWRPSYPRRRSRSHSLERSLTPIRRRVRSPLYHRSPSPSRRRRSPSPVRRRRSPSPIRRRRSPSPVRRRRSPSPIRRRRSPSPVRRRRSPSPARRRRSPLPVRRRSPRSPSPVRRISPSPVRRRSPAHLKRRSYSPSQYESPSPGHRRYRKSPGRQRSTPPPIRRRSPVPGHRRLSNDPPQQRSASTDEWSSQSPVRHKSPSPGRKSSRSQRSPIKPSTEKIRSNLSPEVRQPPRSGRSPLPDEERYPLKDKSRGSLSSPEKSPVPSRSQVRKGIVSLDRRSNSSHESPERQTREKLTLERRLSPPQKHRGQKPRCDSPRSSENEETDDSREYNNQKSKSLRKDSVHISPVGKSKDSPAEAHDEENSPARLDRYDKALSRKKGSDGRSDKSERGSFQRSPMKKGSSSAYDSDLHRQSEAILDSGVKTDNIKPTASKDSCSEESNKHRSEEKHRRKHKRSERKEMESDEGCSSDSELEDKKEAKRRKREEKRLRKEEKRRRREERRRRRYERKLKTKSKRDEYSSDGEEVEGRDSHQSDEEPPYEQKKLEIELRNKALESFKAKKGVGH